MHKRAFFQGSPTRAPACDPHCCSQDAAAAPLTPPAADWLDGLKCAILIKAFFFLFLYVNIDNRLDGEQYVTFSGHWFLQKAFSCNMNIGFKSPFLMWQSSGMMVIFLPKSTTVILIPYRQPNAWRLTARKSILEMNFHWQNLIVCHWQGLQSLWRIGKIGPSVVFGMLSYPCCIQRDESSFKLHFS